MAGSEHGHRALQLGMLHGVTTRQSANRGAEILSGRLALCLRHMARIENACEQSRFDRNGIEAKSPSRDATATRVRGFRAMPCVQGRCASCATTGPKRCDSVSRGASRPILSRWLGSGAHGKNDSMLARIARPARIAMRFGEDVHGPSAARGLLQARLSSVRTVWVSARPGESFECGAPGRIRTCDTRLRRPMLYPAELRARERSVKDRCTIFIPFCANEL